MKNNDYKAKLVRDNEGSTNDTGPLNGTTTLNLVKMKQAYNLLQKFKKTDIRHEAATDRGVGTETLSGKACCVN